MVSFFETHGKLGRHRLKRLHDVQEELYRQLQLLLPEQVSHHDFFQSRVPGSPLLRLDVLERHRYTKFLRLTYWFDGDSKPEMAPDAHFRVYEDARMAEVTSFDPDQGFTRTAHPWYPHKPLFQKAWRHNLAMDKWLGYLIQQGHSMETMRASGRIQEFESEVASAVPVT
jgi:uncharacterized protein YqiB (DUF1249 family)